MKYRDLELEVRIQQWLRQSRPPSSADSRISAPEERCKIIQNSKQPVQQSKRDKYPEAVNYVPDYSAAKRENCAVLLYHPDFVDWAIVDEEERVDNSEAFVAQDLLDNMYINMDDATFSLTTFASRLAASFWKSAP
jgi:hypothetical protein